MLETIVRKFLYYPEKVSQDRPLPPVAVNAEEVRFTTAVGDTIHALYWKAPPYQPTVLFLHGNAQTVYEWAYVRQDLEPLNAGLLLIDYPGYGKSTGTPSESGLYAAAEAAFGFLVNTCGIQEQYIVIHGKSLGGGVATHVALRKNVLGVILESTFTSIPAVFRSHLPLIPDKHLLNSERYESIARIDSIKAPKLIIHGTRDRLIPVSHGKKLYESACEPKKLFLIENAEHNNVALRAGSLYGTTIQSWIQELRYSLNDDH